MACQPAPPARPPRRSARRGRCRARSRSVTPRSAATLRALGEASSRRRDLGGAERRNLLSSPGCGMTVATAGAAVTGAGAAVRTASPSARICPTSSPQANVWPGMPIWCSRPPPGAPTSVSVLSVSISMIGWSLSTSAPSATSHSMIVASSIVRPSFGIGTSSGHRLPPERRTDRGARRTASMC